MNGGQSSMGMISAVSGVLAVLGHGCCCMPFIGMFSAFLVIALEAVAIITGVLARKEAAAKGEIDGRARIGLVSGAIAILITVVYAVVIGSAFVAYLFMVVAYLFVAVGVAIAGG